MRVEVDQGDALHLRVFQHFARGQAVAAAQNQHVLRLPAHHLHGGQHEGFMVAGFVARGKLQVAVDVEAQVVVPFGDHQALIGRMAFIHHRIAEIALFSQKGDAVGSGESDQQAGQHDAAAQLDRAVARQLRLEGARGEHGHGGVEQAEQQGGTRHAQPGREH